VFTPWVFYLCAVKNEAVAEAYLHGSFSLCIFSYIISTSNKRVNRTELLEMLTSLDIIKIE